jgi:hypothetical protein
MRKVLLRWTADPNNCLSWSKILESKPRPYFFCCQFVTSLVRLVVGCGLLACGLMCYVSLWCVSDFSNSVCVHASCRQWDSHAWCLCGCAPVLFAEFVSLCVWLWVRLMSLWVVTPYTMYAHAIWTCCLCLPWWLIGVVCWFCWCRAANILTSYAIMLH